MAQARAPSDLPPAKADAVVLGGKETSPELAKLAGWYLGLSREQYGSVLMEAPDKAFEDVRRLAASVLSQTEPQP